MARRTTTVVELPVVTADQVAADRAAGVLSRSWTLPFGGAVAPLRPTTEVGTTDPRPAGPASALPESRRTVVLEVAPGHVVTVGDGAIIGRRVRDATSRTTIPIDDPSKSVSREHAAVRPTDDGGLLVEDLGSANGTTVVRASGGQDASVAGQQVVARPGDTIMVGDYAVRVLVA
jgi:pSer/pThr/pTyr-binding forkhead associated (FHA) protein